jgi:MFS family permease
VLFGPLVLIPQVVASAGGEARAGLILSALPLGFGAAALGAESVLRASWGNRQRGVAGALVCAAALAVLIFLPLSTGALAVMLAAAGLGLGVFVPANNAVIMSVSAHGSAGVLGGLVNMARGIGTALGISAVTLALHLSGPAAGRPPSGGPDPRPALAMLAVIAVAAALTALAGGGSARAGPGGDPAGRHGDRAQEGEQSGAFG